MSTIYDLFVKRATDRILTIQDPDVLAQLAADYRWYARQGSSVAWHDTMMACAAFADQCRENLPVRREQAVR